MFKRFSFTERLILFLSCFLGLVLTFCATRMSAMGFLLIILVASGYACVFIFCLVYFLLNLRRLKKRAPIPLFICLAAIAAAVILIMSSRRVIFYLAFPSYEKVAHMIETGEIKVTSDFKRIPEAEEHVRFVDQIRGQRNELGEVIVEFATESAGRFHSGYLYAPHGGLGEDSRFTGRWTSRKEIKPGWFAVDNGRPSREFDEGVEAADSFRSKQTK